MSNKFYAFTYKEGIVCLLLLASVVWNGYGVDRADFPLLFGAYSCFFALYLWLIWQLSKGALRMGAVALMALGMGLRGALLWSTPSLSDDWYRFLWDGMLSGEGIHPFLYTPKEAMARFVLPEWGTALFPRLNSPDYFTVYPPLGQWAFWLAAKAGQGHLSGALFCLKLLLWAGEGLTMWVLYRYLRQVLPGFARMGLALYAVNPLVILETAGNCHFEGLMGGFLCLGLWTLHRGRAAQAGAYWAAAIAVKLLPLLFLPAVLAWLRGPQRWRFALGGSVAGLLLFLPLLHPDVLRHMWASIGLYFHQFELNASIYYLASYGARWITGWYEGRLVSPYLAMATTGCALGIAWVIGRSKAAPVTQLQFGLFLCAAVFLLNAAAVHPWYLIVPFLLSIGARTPWVLVWTWVAFLSYSHYWNGQYKEEFGWIFTAYLTVALSLGLQWRQQKRAD